MERNDQAIDFTSLYHNPSLLVNTLLFEVLALRYPGPR